MPGEVTNKDSSVNQKKSMWMWGVYAHRRQRRKAGPRLYVPIGEPPVPRWRVRMAWANPAYDGPIHTEDFRRWFPACAEWCDSHNVRIDTANHDVEGSYVTAFCDHLEDADALVVNWKTKVYPYTSPFGERSMKGNRLSTSRIGTREMTHNEEQVLALFPHRVEIRGGIDLSRMDAHMRAPYYLSHRLVPGFVANPFPRQATLPVLFFIDHRDAVFARLMDET